MIMQPTIHAVLGATLSLALFQPALAAWPEDRPIEVVVGFPAGGGTDIMARKLIPFMEKRLGGKARFIVLNKPGAAGEISTTAIARAEPDGYTIGVVNVPSFLFVPMTKKSQYSPDDVRLVARVVDDPTVVVVRADSKLSNLKDIVEALRAKPGSITFGHNGVGSNGHLALRLMADATKVQANEVPYRGTAAQKTDLLGGHLEVGLISAGEVAELHGGAKGDLKVIAILAKSRLPALPGVPTAEEAGVPVVMSSERGFAVAKSVPDMVVRALEAAIADSVRDPEFIASSPGDAPVLSYASGSQWKESLSENAKVLRAIADTLPKDSLPE
jgi:tripartite-type tricarboxylate transporter receptor subunit TctC